MIKIAIADDNLLLQQSIHEKMDFFGDVAVAFKAVDGEDLLEKLEQNRNVDLILMDIEMPKMNGIQATEAVKNNYPHIKIIMLTVFDNDENIFNAIMAGADGYLLKDLEPDKLHNAIVETLNGGAAMTPSIAFKTLKLFRNPEEFQNLPIPQEHNLTTREIEILEQLSKGLKYASIADNLFISNGTVRKHVENIYDKLRVHNKLEAIQKAKSNRLI
ncbi:MAG: response regulator [Paludibacteraceae bacterium]